MRNWISMFVVLAMLACASTVVAAKPVEPEEGPLPTLLVIVAEMPDGTVQAFTLPTEAPEVSEMMVETYIPIIYIPPTLVYWNPGFFYYASYLWFGWIGPNGSLVISLNK